MKCGEHVNCVKTECVSLWISVLARFFLVKEQKQLNSYLLQLIRGVRFNICWDKGDLIRTEPEILWARFLWNATRREMQPAPCQQVETPPSPSPIHSELWAVKLYFIMWDCFYIGPFMFNGCLIWKVCLKVSGKLVSRSVKNLFNQFLRRQHIMFCTFTYSWQKCERHFQ